MKDIIFLFLFLSISINISSAQKMYKKKYKEKREANSRLIQSHYNYTFEKLPNKTFVFKRYYPENKMITHFYTYSDRRMTTLNGLCQERYDDGTVVNSGIYENNRREGEWIEDRFLRGNYNNDLRQGEWTKVNDNNDKIEVSNYLNGELHGMLVHYNAEGEIQYKSEYDNGVLISTTRDTSNIILEISPRFPGCEMYALEGEELDSCAQRKMLEYIYGNLRYPEFARKNNIQGEALLTFVVDKNGDVTEITVLRGVSKHIKKEVLQLVESLPRWSPGIQNGKKIKVKYTLPIKFRLED